MGLACAEDSSPGFSFPRNLSLWWSGETENVLQRIERWAAYARGYNRLRPVRFSPGRLSMQEQRPGCSPGAERARLSCCALGNLGYQSNGNLESGCLEAYSLDHSIYFKTIGELRSEGRPAGPGAPLDCGDFLASDFDDEPGGGEEGKEEEEEEEEDAPAPGRGLLEQLDELGPAPLGGGVIRVCRSAISEDEINNNFTTTGLPKGFARAAAAAR